MKKYHHTNTRINIDTSAWIVTFSDLLLLLLTCFALKLTTELPASFKIQDANSTINDNSNDEKLDLNPKTNTTSDFIMLENNLQQITKRINYSSLRTEKEGKEISHIISLDSNCFEAGTTTATFQTNELILTIANLATTLNWDISVSSFISDTDRSLSSTIPFWSLAQARTNMLLVALMENGVSAQKLSGIGNGANKLNAPKITACIEIKLKQNA